MAEMSLDSAASDIGSQIGDIAMSGLQAGISAVTTVTGLVPAGSDSVSLQAAVSFATEGMQALQQQASALQELMSTSQAIQQIVQQYASADTGAASAVAASAFQGGSGALGALGAGQLAAAAPQLMATAGQAGSLASAGAPTLMSGFSQGMQAGQSLQGAVSGMSGGSGGGGAPMSGGGVPPGGMSPHLANRGEDDTTTKTIDQPEELVDGASAGTDSPTAAPIQLAVSRPETTPSRIEL
jgi:hypothetical protein